MKYTSGRNNFLKMIPELQERHLFLCEQSSETVIVANGCLRYASPACARMLGAGPEWLFGQRLADCVPESQHELVARALGEPSEATEGFP